MYKNGLRFRTEHDRVRWRGWWGPSTPDRPRRCVNVFTCTFTVPEWAGEGNTTFEVAGAFFSGFRCFPDTETSVPPQFAVCPPVHTSRILQKHQSTRPSVDSWNIYRRRNIAGSRQKSRGIGAAQSINPRTRLVTTTEIPTRAGRRSRATIRLAKAECRSCSRSRFRGDRSSPKKQQSLPDVLLDGAVAPGLCKASREHRRPLIESARSNGSMVGVVDDFINRTLPGREDVQ